MKIICESKKFYDSIANSEDKKRFVNKYFSGLKTFENMPLVEVSLYDAKTRHQLGAIWLDWTNVAKLLYTSPECIYYELIKDNRLQDCWIEETTIGKNKQKSFRFITLSGFSKDHIIETNFISRYRDILQERVNKEYGEFVYIKWAKKENLPVKQEK